MTSTANSAARKWIVLFVIAAAVISVLKLTGAIDSTTGFILLAVAMLLLIPFQRALARSRSSGANQASVRYTRRIVISSLLYVLGLGIAITLDRRMELTGAMALVIALLPVLPIFGMIWAMARYIIEEKDEFLRHRAIMAALIGLAAVLGIASFWGFLEQFRLVPHAYGWWALPIWAIAMGLAQGILGWRDRREAGE
ncbi:hypothetical protein GRI58_11250 [Porphyrobacter algicida]|uniref:Uncharacterized protein n=1 Tax=Qipengyuania algicida TaxID=1836209 RepID=A0A845AIZ9_9SPHN|nr:hypothetical protein [Qipengyuania algicida]MXP29399.1 hypothetical protein [Qipengyuania algicida]